MALVQAQIFPENFSGNFLLFRREHVRLTNRVTDICQELRDSYSLLYDCATCFQHRRYKSSKLGKDGVYIIGQNMLIPVESVSEGYELIKLLRGKDAKRNRR